MPFTLYWSSLARYESCPQGFLWGRGWGAIDVGGGPGRRKPQPYKKSEHHAVMGVVIQAVIERFYNDDIWKFLKKDELKARLLDLCAKEFDLELARRFVDWRLAPRKSDMMEIIRDGVMGYMQTLKAQKLLGPYSRAEVDLVAYIDKYNPIGGRVDTIIRRDDTGITIIDGKNSRRYKDGKGGLMTYTDPDQLRWYALCFYLSHDRMPDRVGFCYYRYPYGAVVLDVDGKPVLDDEGKEITESGVEWVEFTKEDLQGLAQRALDARKGMDKEQFEACPHWKTCRFCDHESVCPERQAQKAKNRRKPKNVDEQLDGVVGIQIISFDN